MILDLFSLKGKVCVVTGGGQGLGRAFSQAFAEAGANVMIAEFNDKTGPQAAEEITKSTGNKAAFVRTDVRKCNDLKGAVDAAVKAFGRLDVMMNNAGITDWLEAELLPEEKWRNLMAINLDGVFYGCQAAFPVMQKQGGGSIINTASMSGHIVNVPQKQASYNTSKAAVIHLTKSLAVEWAKHKIRVNCISPGYMNGPMAGPFFDNPEYGPAWRTGIAMRRPGEPVELCGAALLLASEAGSYMTGSDVVIDGGFTCV